MLEPDILSHHKEWRMSSITTTDNKTFLNELARLVGHSHLLTDPAKTARYRKGFRSGQGEALAVVFPGSLLELWRVLNACVNADKIILMQAANTGLTEGSTPNGNDYDREIVIISTLRLDKLHVLGKGEQVLAYPGTTLYSLEKALKPLGELTDTIEEIGGNNLSRRVEHQDRADEIGQLGRTVRAANCKAPVVRWCKEARRIPKCPCLPVLMKTASCNWLTIWGSIWDKRQNRS